MPWTTYHGGHFLQPARIRRRFCCTTARMVRWRRLTPDEALRLCPPAAAETSASRSFSVRTRGHLSPSPMTAPLDHADVAQEGVTSAAYGAPAIAKENLRDAELAGVTTMTHAGSPRNRRGAGSARLPLGALGATRPGDRRAVSRRP